MRGMGHLMREYERARFPLDRRLDLHGEGPKVARERALHWIQSRAHEAPGQELLLIVTRAGAAGSAPSPVERAVRRLLEELDGTLLAWWQPFAPGSLALRIADEPCILLAPEPAPLDLSDGRTKETAGAARPAPQDDIPAELLPALLRAAEVRIEREGLSHRILEVVLREVWIEAQAHAMEARLSFEAAAEHLLAREEDHRSRFQE